MYSRVETNQKSKGGSLVKNKATVTKLFLFIRNYAMKSKGQTTTDNFINMKNINLLFLFNCIINQKAHTWKEWRRQPPLIQ